MLFNTFKIIFITDMFDQNNVKEYKLWKFWVQALKKLSSFPLCSWEPCNHLQASEPKETWWRKRGHLEDVLGSGPQRTDSEMEIFK